MKKFLFLAAIMLLNLNASAQVMEVYHNGHLMITFHEAESEGWEFRFKKSEDPEPDPNPSDGNLLPGTFTVGEGKTVQFTKGNLYWDGSVFRFEANQTDYPTFGDVDHVGHFYWTNIKDYQSGNASYMPYAHSYSYSSQSTSDEFFCGEEHPLTIDGSSGFFALSKDEWNYLISARSNATNLCKYGVTVGSNKNCLIIAPDSFTDTLKSSYTLDEVNALDLVCLPSTGIRTEIDYGFPNAEILGNYWSATPFSNNSDNAYSLYLSSDYVFTADYCRNIAESIRLVRLAQ